MYDICCIGHLTHDKIVTPHHTVHMAGGTSFYFSHAIKKMPVRYHLVTSLAKTDIAFAEDLIQAGIDTTVLSSEHTVYFENIYPDQSDHREQKVLFTADPFQFADIAALQSSIFHLGPLLAEDMSAELIQALAAKSRVSLDVQGYLRKVIDQEVVATSWSQAKQVLPYISILKANETEAEKLTGLSDHYGAAKYLADTGVKEVIITLGSKGSLIYAEGNFYEVPAIQPSAVVDATGCGDTYMAGYLYKRFQKASYYEAGIFGAAMASVKIAASGPFNGTETAITDLLNS
ncbi:PfkB family carbohydrate kinase [Sediminibacterium sp. KACHI17]|uniref:PfkB family carbohydrate kinase n=1 Tax=Sediminibacterium sp. KACHI17 TaxID=1751071 RepID=A0AAT9GL25_9BACT